VVRITGLTGVAGVVEVVRAAMVVSGLQTQFV